ncbi:hypothetical protein [Streptomyces sp. NPDC057686]|uniref:hypothetical protein n=1 Tax=Streptomyces sp. NPDC057686 TaxID=3346212 RepID=UPI003685D88B
MAWTAPMTAVANTAFTAAQFNTYVRDNLLETAPAKAANHGGYFVTSSANSIVERKALSAAVDTAEGATVSGSFDDLTTAGPTVTITTGSNAIVFTSCRSYGNKTDQWQIMGVDVSGASTFAASDNDSLFHEAPDTSSRAAQGGTFHMFTLLTPGVNTFTAKYRVSGSDPTGVGTFSYRRLAVLPF